MRSPGSCLAVVVVLTLASAGCGDDDAAPAAPTSTEAATADPTSTEAATADPTSTEAAGRRHPDVIDAVVTPAGDGTFTVSATLSSPYDTPERYADAWRVLAPDGTVLGVRELAHDHATEQPFTRSLSGVEIPLGVDTVTVEGRDLVNGWGGATLEVAVER